YLYLNVAAEDLDGEVHLPYADIREVFGLTLDQDDPEAIRSEIDANLAQLMGYASDKTSIVGGGAEYELSFDGFQLLSDIDEEDEIGYAIFPFDVALPTADVPRVLDVTFDPFLSEIDDRRNIVLVANDWRRGVFDEEANELQFLSEGSPSAEVDLGNPSQWLNFRGSVELGVDHIRTGPDHIFFVMVLLLPSVLLFTTRWEPAPSFGSALWRVLKIVTMFTIAHSITFTLAGQDILPLPSSRLVESVIALSIAAAAIHNLRPVLRNREWLMAFLFGLFHGMGFASLVEALNVSRTTQLVSLIGRNVGIEIGQAIVILVVFPSLFLLSRTRIYQPLFVIGSLALAAISFLWAIERIAGVDLQTGAIIDPIVAWPRSLFAMIVVTIACAAFYWSERRADRLVAVAGESQASGDVAAGDEVSTSIPSAK
ncbi:MAG: HupE/UreJ family protein, partial [Actinomycetota bacterium]